MSGNREAELQAYGCASPEWFLRDHIPLYAKHFGVDFEVAYQSVLGELAALQEVRNINFAQMEDSGVEHRMMQIFDKRGKLAAIGERPLIIIDNFVYMQKTLPPANPDNPFDRETIIYDPHTPLAIGNFSTMDDPIARQCVEPIAIGRPNSDGELWLSDGITVEDYEVAKECFYRLLALRVEGRAPHLVSSLDKVLIPRTLGDPERPYDSSAISHGPVEYEGIATELKLAS